MKLAITDRINKNRYYVTRNNNKIFYDISHIPTFYDTEITTPKISTL